MHQDESGCSYYYEDVHYDEGDENDSDSDEELDVYNHTEYSESEAYLYAARSEYSKDHMENIHNHLEETTQILDSLNYSKDKIEENPALEDTIHYQEKETESSHTLLEVRPEIEVMLHYVLEMSWWDFIDPNLALSIEIE